MPALWRWWSVIIMQKRKKKRNAKHLSWTTSLSNILSIVVTSGIFAVELWAFLNSSGGLSDQLPSLTERHLECENMSILLYYINIWRLIQKKTNSKREGKTKTWLKLAHAFENNVGSLRCFLQLWKLQHRFAAEICLEVGLSHNDSDFQDCILPCRVKSVVAPVNTNALMDEFLSSVPVKNRNNMDVILTVKRVLTWRIHCSALPRNKRKNHNSRKASKPGLSHLPFFFYVKFPTGNDLTCVTFSA